MQTSAIALAVAGSACAANLNVLMRRENSVVCRTYTSTVLVPCSTTSIIDISSSILVPTSSLSSPLATSSTPASRSCSGSTTPVESSSTPVESSSTPTPTLSETTSSSSSTTSSAPTPTSTLPIVPGFYCGCEWLINDETLYCVNKTTGAYEVEYDNLAGGRGAKFNALAFHPQTLGLVSVVDDPAYQKPVLGIIDGDGTYTLYEDLIASKWKVGEIDEDLNYWVMDNLTYAQIEVNIYAGPNNDGSLFGKTKSTGVINFGYYVYDWAYLQGTGKYLWSIGTSKDDGSSALVRWSTTDNSWTVIQNYGNIDGVNEWGPAWGYLDSKLWMQESQTGDIYEVNVPDGDPTKLSTAEVITPAFNNDGAKCWNNSLSYDEANGPPPPGY